MKTNTARFTARFRSVGNPDHGQYAPVSNRETVEADTLRGVAAAWRAYIERWGLGGGKMAEPDPQELQQQLEKLQSGLGGSNPTGLPGLGGGPALPPGFNPFKK